VKRRTVAGLVAAALVIALATVAATRSVPYVTFAPGPTVNVLGEYEKKPIIEVSGHKTYRDDGQLRLLTVIPSGPDEKISLVQLLLAWADPDKSVYPYRAIYGSTDTQKTVQQQSTVQMDTSQSDAVAAALSALKVPFATNTDVASVEKGGPAAGKLRAGDRIVKVDGTKIGSYVELAHAIQPVPVGHRITIVVRRQGKLVVTHLRTTASPTNPKASAVLITVSPSYDFPFQVKLNIDKDIGGPSGGLMFSMAIYDTLTPGSLTGSKVVAGTGEIDPSGTVSPIGGIQQKLVAAQAAGAKLFLAPADNCAEALGGNFDPDKMRLVKVTKLTDAIDDVKAWVKNPKADLPRCTK
jgi:PDZ domain-containing protein